MFFSKYEMSLFYDIAVSTVNFKNVLKAWRFSLLSSKAKALRENRIIFEKWFYEYYLGDQIRKN